MEPFFTEEQLNGMSRENLIELMKLMKEQSAKKDTEIQLLKDKQKELEFMNAMLSDRLALARRKQFGSSSEKYAEGYEQMDLFNEAEASADPEAGEPTFEEVHPSSYKRKKRTGKKEEDLSGFEVTETIEYKLAGEDRYCPECGKKYKIVTKETVKRLKFVPAKFEVVEEVTGENTAAGFRRKHRDTIPGGRDHECQVCQRHAAGTAGTGIRQIQPEPFHQNHGKLDYRLCEPLPETAV